MKVISISIDRNLYEKLKHITPSKKISQFISFATSNELDKKELELAEAYKNTEGDKERQELLSDWDAADEF